MSCWFLFRCPTECKIEVTKEQMCKLITCHPKNFEWFWWYIKTWNSIQSCLEKEGKKELFNSHHLSHYTLSQYPHDSFWKCWNILGGRHDIECDDIDISMPAKNLLGFLNMPLHYLLLCGVLFNTYIPGFTIYLTDSFAVFSFHSLVLCRGCSCNKMYSFFMPPHRQQPWPEALCFWVCLSVRL